MSETVEEPVVETETEPDEQTDTPAEPDEDAETDEEMDADVDVDAPTPTPAPEMMTERQLEEASKKLEQSAKTWRSRVETILGEAANDLVPCELCNPIIPGFHFPAELEQPRDDQHARLLEVLRTPSAPEFQLATHVRRCGTCDGYGQVLSGSKVPGKERVTCPTCKGNGFQGQGDVPSQPQTQPGNGQVEFPADTQPLTQDDNDAWGSPRLLDDGQENPNYGRAPSYKNPSLP